MNAAEVAFLRAEAAAVYNFNMGGEAGEFYNTGIRLSFEQWGADGAEEYLNNETLRPETYVDPDGKNSYDRDLSRITVKWDNAASPEENRSVLSFRSGSLIGSWVMRHGRITVVPAIRI